MEDRVGVVEPRREFQMRVVLCFPSSRFFLMGFSWKSLLRRQSHLDHFSPYVWQGSKRRAMAALRREAWHPRYETDQGVALGAMAEEDAFLVDDVECGLCVDNTDVGIGGRCNNSLFDVYTNVESAKELCDSLESKYMADDSSSKKFLDFKHTLKHGKDDLSLVQLGNHLRIEESLRAQDSDKGKGKEVGGPSVNMTEEGKNKQNKVEDGFLLYMGDEHFTPVHGKESVALEFSSGKTVTLFNVLYVPKLRKNLVSGHVLNKCGYKQVYESDKYILSKCGVFVRFGYYNNAPYTPQQNGVAERKNRALKEMVNSILSYLGLSEGFWGESMLTACYLLNKDPNKRNKATPYELWYKKRPNLSFLRVWGCRVVVRLPDLKGKILDEKVIKSRDAIFDENRFSSIPSPKDIIPNVQESQMDDHTDDVPNEIPETRKGKRVRKAKSYGCKWIFKRRMKVDGTIDNFEARLVIQCFRQNEGIDYFDTYAPVARITIIILLSALAAIHNLVIHQMDVKTAFLNGDLDEEVYMKQPEGFVMPGNEHKVCKLIKSLYGLKQAPKQWHQKFNEVVLISGFHLNQSDKCVYSNFDNSGEGVIICLYVDDMLIFGTDQNQVDKTKKFLSSRFSMKDMGEADVILGIKIKCENKGIVITQSHYIEKIPKNFNREDCSPVSTTMDPDIAYVVGRLSRFTSNHSRQHWKAITRVFKYLRCTKDYALSYVGYHSMLEGYSDASQINYVENLSSTSGWVFLLGGGAISWASKKQTCITGSTIEYEFVALVAAGKEA
uniref:Zinc finger, CCHC-type n=1 Tax=Tanacetum cinerariifolium TaxID=118510 RepID=A0A6L2MQE8_TANCI|nr:zinc finger, CCHC-type [Tanacetum cinerariifolium]